ncbi:MAG: signal peptidase II [Caldilineaceae bacterium]|nr:signal peptidase II [Caldilineaceae bacterium]
MISWLRRAWLVLVVAGIIITLDQLTKEWVRLNIPKYGAMIPIPALGEYFVFEHVDNYGAAFGILQNQGMLFVVIAVVVAIAILVYARYLPVEHNFVRILLGLQLGGAVGNLVDRINQGYVTDFVKMGIPGVYYWPNYNIADSSIVIGVIALGVYIMVDDVRKQREQQAQPQANERL